MRKNWRERNRETILWIVFIQPIESAKLGKPWILHKYTWIPLSLCQWRPCVILRKLGMVDLIQHCMIKITNYINELN